MFDEYEDLDDEALCRLIVEAEQTIEKEKKSIRFLRGNILQNDFEDMDCRFAESGIEIALEEIAVCKDILRERGHDLPED